MITPDELKAHLDMLRASGVTGKVKIGDIEVTIAPPVEKQDPVATRKSRQKEYDMLLFGATEGIPDEEIEAKS